jgi:hypothetical protein
MHTRVRAHTRRIPKLHVTFAASLMHLYHNTLMNERLLNKSIQMNRYKSIRNIRQLELCTCLRLCIVSKSLHNDNYNSELLHVIIALPGLIRIKQNL